MARLTPASGLWHLAVTRLMPASSLWHLAVTWLMPASDLWHLTVTRLTPVSDLWHQTVPCLTSGVLFSLFVEMSWLMVRHSALCVPRRRASTRRSWWRVTLSASCGRRSKPTPPSSSPRGRQNHRQSLTPVPAPGRAQLAAVQQGYSFFCLPSSFFYLPSFVCLLLSFICLLLSAFFFLLSAFFCLPSSFFYLPSFVCFFFSQSDSLLSFSQSVCLLFSTFCLPSFGHLASAFFWPSPLDHLLATLFWLPSFGHLLSAIGHLFWAIFFGPSSVGILLAAFCPSSFGCFGRLSAFYCFLLAAFFDHHLAIFWPDSFAYPLCLSSLSSLDLLPFMQFLFPSVLFLFTFMLYLFSCTEKDTVSTSAPCTHCFDE